MNYTAIMTQGVKVETTVSKKEVIEAIYECDGMLLYASKKLFISRNSLNEYIDRNDLWHEVKKAREQHKDKMVDIGLFGSQKLAEQLKLEPAVALKACLDALNRYGKDRGVSMNDPQDTNEQVANLIKLLQTQIGPPALPKE